MKEGYKKTEVGVIPDDWEVKSINQLIKDEVISDVMDGNHGAIHPKSSDYVEKGIPFIMANNLKNGKLDIENCNFISKETSSRLKKGFAKEGDVLITHKGTLGLTAIVPKLDTEYIVLTPQVTYYRIEGNNILKNEYLKYLFDTNLYQNILKKLGAQSTRDYVGITEQKKINVIVPPLKEQEKIAEILSTVDSQIDDTEKLVEKSKELKKGLMQKLLTKGIGHSEFKKTEVGEIPVSWEVKKFKDVSKINQGLQIAIEDRFKEKLDNRLPYITIQYINDKNNKDNEFYIENANESVICTEDEILMTRTGNTGQVVTNEHGVFHNNFFKIDFDRKVLDKDYLVYYLKSRAIQSLIMRYAGTTTIPDLKHSDFYRIPIVLPSIDEQKIISEILISIDNEIEEYKNKKQKLEELKKGLMQQLLTGKIRVTI